MKMEIIGPLLLSLIAGLSTMIGGILIFFKIKNINNFIVISLSFSISIMILISLFDLIPNGLSIILNNYGFLFGIIIAILTFLLGYLTIFILLDKIKSESSLYKIGILSMIALMLHNFPEGIAVFMSSYVNIKIGFKLFLAIVLHNIPEGISIAVPLYFSGKSRGVSLKYTFISGIAEPIGALITYLFLRNHINNLIISFILLFVSGLMVSLSFNEIYKEIKNYNINYSLIGYIIGIILFIILSIFI